MAITCYSAFQFFLIVNFLEIIIIIWHHNSYLVFIWLKRQEFNFI